MNRRDFLNLTAGSALAAVAPFPRMGVAAPAVQVPRNLFAWETAMARAGNPISTKTLGQALKVSPDQAGVVMNKLVTRGVVAAPNAAGVARSITPAFKDIGIVAERTTISTQSSQNSAMDAVKDMFRNSGHPTKDSDPKQPENAPIPSTDDSAPPEVSDAARSTE